MWFRIALLSFFLIVFLVVKVAARGRRRIHDVGLQQGSDVSLQDISSGSGEPAQTPGEVGALAAGGSSEAGAGETAGSGETDA